VISAALSGERNPVLLTEDDGFLISFEDKGPYLTVNHETNFRHFNEPDYQDHYVPLLGSDLEKAVEGAHLGFLIYPAEGGGFRYDAYAGQGEAFGHVGYDILAALAHHEVLDKEMSDLIGQGWKDLVSGEPAAAFSR
jgi:hypothetical protein